MAGIAAMFTENWFSANTAREHPTMVRGFHDMAINTDPDGLAGSFAAVRDADLRRTIALIRAPTLVIGGIDDTVTIIEHSRQIADAIPGAELVVMPGVHMLNVERPDTFVGAVGRFLTAEDGG